MKSTKINEFYNQIGFPGLYTINDLKWYGDPIENYYLNKMQQYISGSESVLDAGCGTGLTTNFFALRNPNTTVTGIDFSDSIEYAKHFATSNSIENVSFERKDILKINKKDQYDVVICQGVLHHIPEYKSALSQLAAAVKPGGILILGVYHPWGKIVKKYFNIDYGTRTLYLDQEENPYENSFNQNQIIELAHGFTVIEQGPTFMGSVSIPAFFNYKSGGLFLTVLSKDSNDPA